MQEGMYLNTGRVIDLLKGISNKHLYRSVMFDIKNFCPSITENLLEKILTFAEARTLLSDDDKAIIHNAKKLLLFNNLSELKITIYCN